jgi:hypothetical protein
MPEEMPNGVPPSDAIIVDGIVRKFALHRQRLESHRPGVIEMLSALPDEFFEGKGGGWTFLNMCNDKGGHQWAEHRDMEALCVLAIGLKLGHFQMPREMWSAFPGGVPYVVFSLQEKGTIKNDKL